MMAKQQSKLKKAVSARIKPIRTAATRSAASKRVKPTPIAAAKTRYKKQSTSSEATSTPPASTPSPFPQFTMPTLQTSAGVLYTTFSPSSNEHWRQWLDMNHAKMSSIWVVYYKKASKVPTIEYSAAVDQALCYGWIDSTRKSVSKLDFVNDQDGERYADEEDPRYIQLFTPRNVKRSTWSKVNKAKVEKLILENLMKPAGLAVIDAAKANGQWTSLDHVEDMIIPADLATAFEEAPGKSEKFDALSRSAKRILLLTISQAKRQETRDKRIKAVLAQLD